MMYVHQLTTVKHATKMAHVEIIVFLSPSYSKLQYLQVPSKFICTVI
jgi:hypothetical protein